MVTSKKPLLLCGQLLFEPGHRFPKQMGRAGHVKLDVIAGRFDPIDLVRVQHHHAARRRDDDARLAARARSQSLCETFDRRGETLFAHRFEEIVECLRFEGADRVYILDVYSAGEENTSGVSAADLAHQVPNGLYVGDFQTAKEALENIVGPDDLVLLMGAGDIKKLGDELAHKV